MPGWAWIPIGLVCGYFLLYIIVSGIALSTLLKSFRDR